MRRSSAERRAPVDGRNEEPRKRSSDSPALAVRIATDAQSPANLRQASGARSGSNTTDPRCHSAPAARRARTVLPCPDRGVESSVRTALVCCLLRLHICSVCEIGRCVGERRRQVGPPRRSLSHCPSRLPRVCPSAEADCVLRRSGEGNPYRWRRRGEMDEERQDDERSSEPADVRSGHTQREGSSRRIDRPAQRSTKKEEGL